MGHSTCVSSVERLKEFAVGAGSFDELSRRGIDVEWALHGELYGDVAEDIEWRGVEGTHCGHRVDTSVPGVATMLVDRV